MQRYSGKRPKAGGGKHQLVYAGGCQNAAGTHLGCVITAFYPRGQQGDDECDDECDVAWTDTIGYCGNGGDVRTMFDPDRLHINLAKLMALPAQDTGNSRCAIAQAAFDAWLQNELKSERHAQ